jgi:hypothetical protein
MWRSTSCFIPPLLMCLTLAPGLAWAEPPRATDDLRAVLEQTACIIEGDVTNIQYTYEGMLGPRTVVTLAKTTALAGSCPSGDLALPLAGGPLPNGRFMRIAELPRISLGAHYLLFLRNTDWFHSPILFGHTLRVETVAGREVLIDEDGYAVRSISRAGLASGGLQLFDARSDNSEPFARPKAHDGVVAADVAGAFDRALLLKRVTGFSGVENIAIGGSFQAQPTKGRAWNSDVAVLPGKCNPDLQSCR